MASAVSTQLQTLSDEFQALQQELQTNVAARQKLEAQQQENIGVKKEFDSLSDDTNIYKMVGPVLLKQDRAEAKMAVEGRLEFIGKEIKRFEELIQSVQAQSEEKKLAIYQLQSQTQQ